MKVCPKCATTYTDIDCLELTVNQFCTTDGTKLIPNSRCECGKIAYPSERYCAKCGKPVNQEVKP
jgi:hypothetical protein